MSPLTKSAPAAAPTVVHTLASPVTLTYGPMDGINCEQVKLRLVNSLMRSDSKPLGRPLDQILVSKEMTHYPMGLINRIQLAQPSMYAFGIVKPV